MVVILVLKRYLLPPVAAFALYTAAYFLFGNGIGYFDLSLAAFVSYFYAIRFADDITDHKEDKERGRAPVPIWALSCLLTAAISAIAICCFIGGYYPMLFPLVFLPMLLFLPERISVILKPLYIPAVVTAMTFSAFSPNLCLIAVNALLIAADVLIIVISERKL